MTKKQKKLRILDIGRSMGVYSESYGSGISAGCFYAAGEIWALKIVLR